MRHQNSFEVRIFDTVVGKLAVFKSVNELGIAKHVLGPIKSRAGTIIPKLVYAGIASLARLLLLN